jgi:hypothetical protein
MTEFFLLSFDWSGKNLYRTTDRLTWRVKPDDREVAGYVRVVNNTFFQVIIKIRVIIETVHDNQYVLRNYWVLAIT